MDGDDLLPDIGKGDGAKGFTPPLTGPSYTLWMQQFDQDTTYQLDFVVNVVPEPSTWLLFAAGAASVLWCRQRQKLSLLDFFSSFSGAADSATSRCFVFPLK
jgi:hypothetical protein